MLRVIARLANTIPSLLYCLTKVSIAQKPTFPPPIAVCESFHLFEISRLPTPVKGRLLRAVDAEVNEPSLARNGFDPFAFVTGRSLVAEVEIDCGAGLVLQLEQGAQSGLVLISLDLRARLGVINRH